MRFAFITLAFITLALVFTPFTAFGDDNIADCEIVVQQNIHPEAVEKSGAKAGAKIATFLPAGEFIYSVFDANPGHIDTIEGKKIRALMCVRSTVVPTEFDAKLIETGIPIYLSPDFDAPDSPFLGIEKKQERYELVYNGKPLSDKDQKAVANFLERLNAKH